MAAGAIMASLGLLGLALWFARKTRPTETSGHSAGASRLARELGVSREAPGFQALWEALLEVGGERMSTVGADEDLQNRYGLVDEDVDDMVESMAIRLWGDTSVLTGHFVDTRTPRELLEFVERVKSNHAHDAD